MIKFSKNNLYLWALTEVLFSFLSNLDVKASSRSPILFSCHESKPYFRCNDGKEHIINIKMYKFTEISKEKEGDASFILPAVIVAQESGTIIQATRVEVQGSDIVVGDTYGVIASRGGKVILSDSVFKDVSTGLKADNGMIVVDRGVIEVADIGVYAKNQGTSVILTQAKIKVERQEANQSAALFSSFGADIKMAGGAIDVVNAAALHIGTKGRVTLEDVIITSKNPKVVNRKDADERDDISHAVLNVNQSSSLYLKNTNVVATNVHGLRIGLDTKTQLSTGTEGNILVSWIDIEDSKITVAGNKHGMHFNMGEGNNDYEQGVVILKKTAFEVPNGTVIHSSKSSGYVAVSKDSKVSGDLLLKVEKGASVGVLVDSSLLTGGVRIADDSTAELYMTGGSKWILTKPKNTNPKDSNHVSSFVSFLKLSDSVITFETPTSKEYQILHIGNGKGEVYTAQGSADLYLNTYLNGDGSFNDQKTDRFLIYGDVSGKTTVHVQLIAGNKGEAVSDKNMRSISIIQVSGKAAEDSFQLNSAYIALDGLPYQYYLHAYGPDSSLGDSHVTHRLVNGDRDFWDFRLESKYVQPVLAVSAFPFEPKIRDIVPQVPTYLLVPNVFFHVGLMGIINKNEHLEAVRFASSEMLDTHENSAVFGRSYGGNYHYVSDLSALEYGYAGDFSYKAVEAGVLLQKIESTYNTISLGVMGSYGKFSLQPLNVEQSQESAFDQWSVTAYGSMQHDAGFYVDGLFSYSHVKGDVVTLARGKTATLKGHLFSTSLTVGKEFMVGAEGFVFDPQVQVVYQHLQFNRVRDIDNFDIEMGKLEQWVARFGGRLSKTLTESEKDNSVVSFYGKLHFSHGFRGKQTVRFKDDFQLGAFGSSLEAGLGINTQVSSKFMLHGDVLYQHRLNKVGFSGISFSGGLHYRF
ncbi:autotransporter outer membrane beta-barrel domain-containing protein [Bartonella doshiae]|uniref:autotransporter family protein n=1 Tax=Bartonella doshiae TaxID=33044 RepID=UPI000AFD681A|nr:autotransporter outer membrane beta-barrel domain-containing protein [Bartonella doshiae]